MKNLKFIFVALSIGFVIAFLLGEIVLRIIPSQLNNWNTNLSYIKDDKISYKLEPNTEMVIQQPCFRIEEIHSNSQGFRDSEWDTDAEHKIALLGDSFLEAVQVSDNETCGALLQKMSGVEVMSAGISGFGTVAEYHIYKEYLEQYEPEYVVVMLFPKNDPINNHCKLNESTGNLFFAACPCIEMKEGAFIDQVPDYQGYEISWYEYSFLYHLVKRKLGINNNPMRKTGWLVYKAPYDAEWAESIQVTAHQLELFKSDVTKKGGKFLVTLLPPMDLFYSTEELKTQMGWEEIPEGFDTNYPFEWLRAVMDSKEIPYLDLRQNFYTYAEKHHLPEPWFYYQCNGHFNPLGHWLTALSIKKYIDADTLLQTGTNPDLENAGRSPVDLLGQKAYDQVFESKFYKGNSALNTAE